MKSFSQVTPALQTPAASALPVRLARRAMNHTLGSCAGHESDNSELLKLGAACSLPLLTAPELKEIKSKGTLSRRRHTYGLATAVPTSNNSWVLSSLQGLRIALDLESPQEFSGFCPL